MGFWALRWRRLIHGDTGLEMCADSTVCEYIPHIYGGRLWSPSEKVLARFSFVLNDVCVSVNCIMANQYFLLDNVYLFMINICQLSLTAKSANWCMVRH